MPTYSYRCTECETAFDIQQAFTDDTLTVCPNCGGKLRKLFNAVGVSFSGSGFYRNDSRPKPKEGASSSAKEGGSSKDGGSSSSAKEGGASSDSSSKPAPASAPTPAPAASGSKD
jgi:putative FmdB family regulatory protein